MVEEFKACVVIPAAGIGNRTRLNTPKQFYECAGRPLICHTIEAFNSIEWITNIIVTVSLEHRDTLQNLVTKYNYTKLSIVDGAVTRHRSINNGIKAIPHVCSPIPDITIIHDAVRPFVDKESISAVATAAFRCGAAGLLRPLVSTVVSIDSDGFLEESLDRTKYKNSEMPQAFLHSIIKTAYEKCTDYDMDYGTECLHLAQKYAGSKVQLIDGPENLWKVTHMKDIYAAKGMIKELENSVLVVGCPTDARKDAIEKSLETQQLEATFIESLKMEAAKSANHIIIFLDDDKHEENSDSNDQNGEAAVSSLFPDLSACKCLKSLTYVLWSVPDATSGDQEFQDFRSLIKAHHLLGKSHGLCTYGVYIEESLLVEETVFQAEAFDLIAEVVFDSNRKLSGQIFEV